MLCSEIKWKNGSASPAPDRAQRTAQRLAAAQTGRDTDNINHDDDMRYG